MPALPALRARRHRRAAPSALLAVASWVALLVVLVFPDLDRTVPTLRALSPTRAADDVDLCLATSAGAPAAALTTAHGLGLVLLFAIAATTASVWRRRPLVTGLVLCGGAAAAEAVQSLLSNTSCQVSDLLSGCTGAVLGAVAASAALTLSLAARSAERLDGADEAAGDALVTGRRGVVPVRLEQ